MHIPKTLFERCGKPVVTGHQQATADRGERVIELADTSCEPPAGKSPGQVLNRDGCVAQGCACCLQRLAKRVVREAGAE